MFGLVRNRACLIGVDIGEDNLKLVQLSDEANELSLVAGRYEDRPASVPAGTGNWQRWAIDAIRVMAGGGDFRGRRVAAAMPAGSVFIDHMKMPKPNSGTVEDTIFAKIRQRLPFEPLRDNTVLQYLPTEDDNVIVMAMERRAIDIHLAIYEKSGLQIDSIGVWPAALTNCYTRFFGRRKSDLEAVVMLLDIESNCTNLVICRHKRLLFARSIAIGSKELADERAVTRLVLEVTGCKRQFNSLHRSARIERLIFLTGKAVDQQACANIARQLEMSAQIGDCMAAVKIADAHRLGIERRFPTVGRDMPESAKEQINWATAFGLSLS